MTCHEEGDEKKALSSVMISMFSPFSVIYE